MINLGVRRRPSPTFSYMNHVFHVEILVVTSHFLIFRAVTAVSKNLDHFLMINELLGR
jgi:hypothetical protein